MSLVAYPIALINEKVSSSDYIINNDIDVYVYISGGLAKIYDSYSGTSEIANPFRPLSIGMRNIFLDEGDYVFVIGDKSFDVTISRSVDGKNSTSVMDRRHAGGIDLSDLSRDYSSVIDAAAKYIYQLGGGYVEFPATNDKYIRVKGLKFYDGVVYRGAGKTATKLMLVAGSSDPMFTTTGFSQLADDTDHPYRWHSSPAARNTQNYPAGTYVMTNPGGATDWKNPNIRWWKSISGPASSDSDWIEMPPLVGCRGGGIEDMTIDGNYSNVSSLVNGIEYYGIDGQFNRLKIQNFKEWGMWYESPGGTYSAVVGQNLQSLITDLEVEGCGTSPSTGNLYINGQTDTSYYYIMSYVTRNNGYDIKVGRKSGGSRFFGCHTWSSDGEANLPYNWGLYSLADSISLIECHFETRVRLYGTRNNADIKVYRAMAAAALHLGGNFRQSRVSIRTFGFTNAIYIDTEDGGYNDINVMHEGSGSVLAGGSAQIAPTTNLYQRSSSGAGATRNNSTIISVPRTGVAARPSISDRENTQSGFSPTSIGWTFFYNGEEILLLSESGPIVRKSIRLPVYTVATVPTTGLTDYSVIAVSNGDSGNPCLAVRYSGQWRRIPLGAAISAS